MNTIEHMLPSSVPLCVKITLVIGMALCAGSQKSNLEKVNTIRDNVIKHFAKQSDPDLESIKSTNWFYERYLQEYNFKEKEAEKAIIEAVDYFHRERLHEINDTYFPSEAYAVGGLYRFGISKFGQPLIGAVMSHIKPFGVRLSKDYIQRLSQKFCIYNIYRTLFDAKEKNFMIYTVFTNTSIDNTEFSLFHKTMLQINKYIAGAPIKIYVIGMNKILEVAVKLLVNVLKPSLRQKMQFVDRIEQIEDLISLDEVPVHAGGRNTNFARIPPGVKSGKCLAHLSYISGKDWDVYRETNVNAIQEGMKEADIAYVEQYLRDCEVETQ